MLRGSRMSETLWVKRGLCWGTRWSVRAHSSLSRVQLLQWRLRADPPPASSVASVIRGVGTQALAP